MHPKWHPISFIVLYFFGGTGLAEWDLGCSQVISSAIYREQNTGAIWDTGRQPKDVYRLQPDLCLLPLLSPGTKRENAPWPEINHFHLKERQKLRSHKDTGGL